eukprot:TRINITY_DN29275_c0_g1_i1.p1 TRINITY_DN29275_c0_g1~~TRINITY_DN29275_c0_g1_i1.p1  ORF type:complete len:381 (+),score=55.89 TRINITY_DN29275_c0_g1_i1:53-1195(+)
MECVGGEPAEQPQLSKAAPCPAGSSCFGIYGLLCTASLVWFAATQHFGTPFVHSTSTASKGALGGSQHDLPWRASDCFIEPTYDREDVNVLRDISYGTAFNPMSGSDFELLLDLYTPPTTDQRRARPAAVLMHGGSFTSGDKTEIPITEWATILAQRGYVVISINYRLAPAGKEFELQTPIPIVSMAQEDALTAVRYLRKRAEDWRIDTTRIVLGGDSAGAIASLFYAYVPAHKNSTARQSDPSSAISAVMAISGAMKGEVFCRSLDSDLRPHGCAMTAPPAPDLTNEISAGEAPLLLLHGKQDTVIPYLNAKAAFNRAQEVGVRSLLVTIEDGGHVPINQGFDPSLPLMSKWLTFLSGALDLADADCPEKISDAATVIS